MFQNMMDAIHNVAAQQPPHQRGWLLWAWDEAELLCGAVDVSGGTDSHIISADRPCTFRLSYMCMDVGTAVRHSGLLESQLSGAWLAAHKAALAAPSPFTTGGAFLGSSSSSSSSKDNGDSIGGESEADLMLPTTAAAALRAGNTTQAEAPARAGTPEEGSGGDVGGGVGASGLTDGMTLVTSGKVIGSPAPPAGAQWYDGTEEFWRSGPVVMVLWR